MLAGLGRLGDPPLRLVEPGRIGCRQEQVHTRALLQRTDNGLGFVRRQAVDDSRQYFAVTVRSS